MLSGKYFHKPRRPEEGETLMAPTQKVLIPFSRPPSFPPSLPALHTLFFFLTAPTSLFSLHLSQLEKYNLGKVMVHGFSWKLYVIQSKTNSKRTIRIFASCHCFKCAKLPKLRFQTVWKSEQLEAQVPKLYHMNWRTWRLDSLWWCLCSVIQKTTGYSHY